jgi:hypothetical protein
MSPKISSSFGAYNISIPQIADLSALGYAAIHDSVLDLTGRSELVTFLFDLQS